MASNYMLEPGCAVLQCPCERPWHQSPASCALSKLLAFEGWRQSLLYSFGRAGRSRVSALRAHWEKWLHAACHQKQSVNFVAPDALYRVLVCAIKRMILAAVLANAILKRSLGSSSGLTFSQCSSGEDAKLRTQPLLHRHGEAS